MCVYVFARMSVCVCVNVYIYKLMFATKEVKIVKIDITKLDTK